ncbi:DUF456 domain-containing protein [Aureivirga sp. CE67]|uniref:DUF456 domain-containing protein n=1 Tax=Aureivirga sp. CE67 TaxID=1788983 RepID=UPI0018CB6A50|nr:DUF456 domain-containing protein [Aureivirga sp. CE67]
MDIVLIVIGSIFIVLGIVGAIVPGIPGPIMSWVGLLLVNFTEFIPFQNKFIIITALIAIVVTVLDYVIPALGTKKYGGTKYGVWGSIIGLFVGMIFFNFLGVIIGPFIGAFVGELIKNSSDHKRALRAAWGSFVGFIFSTLLKLVLSFVYMYFFIADIIEFF